MGKSLVFSMGVPCNHQGSHKREERRSKIEKEDAVGEAEIGVIHVEDGGRTVCRGRQAASRNLKRQGNALSLTASRKNATLSTHWF